MSPSSLSGPQNLAHGLVKAQLALTSAAVLLLPAVQFLPCPLSLPTTTKHRQKPGEQ